MPSEKLSCLDAEYFIEHDGESTESIIIGVRSKSLNAHCALRIDDEYLSQSTCLSLMRDLYALENNMVHQANNNLLVKGE